MDTLVDEQRLNIKLKDRTAKVRAAILLYVRKVRANFPNEVLTITLYGSQARGEPEGDSDIDLFIVTQQDSQSLRQALSEIAWEVQFKNDVVISDVIRSERQFKRMQAMRFPYYQRIENDGLLLWKSPSEPTPTYA